MNKNSCMKDGEKLTFYVFTVGIAVSNQNDFNPLKEFEESDDFVRESNGDLRKVFGLYADESGTTKRINADAGQKKMRGVGNLVRRMKQELRMKCTPSLLKGTHGRYEDDDLQCVPDVRNSLPEFGNGESSRCAGIFEVRGVL